VVPVLRGAHRRPEFWVPAAIVAGALVSAAVASVALRWETHMLSRSVGLRWPTRVHSIGKMASRGGSRA
jgi:hypothetical protein